MMKRSLHISTSSFLWFQIARIAVIPLILVTLLVYLIVLPVSHEGFEWTNSLANAVYALRYTISRSTLSIIIILLKYTGLVFCFFSGLLLYLLRVLRTKQSDWVSLLASLNFILLPVSFISPQYDRIPSFSGIRVELIFGFLTLLFLLFFIDFGFLFPNGRLFPGWIRIPFYISNLGFGVLFYGLILLQTTSTGLGDSIYIYMLIFLVLIFIIMIFSQIYRYLKGSTPLQRQQTKLVLVGIFLLPVYNFFIQSGIHLLPPAYYALLTLFLQTIVAILLPIAVLLSIYRYRLWEIDLVIRRSLIYGTLSLTLILIYLLSILIFQRILILTIGQSSNVGLVLSTLMIAAIFNPLRNRLQFEIDKRFYRKKFDADKVISEFSNTARRDVGFEEISQEIITIIDKTMQPEFTSIWFIKKK